MQPVAAAVVSLFAGQVLAIEGLQISVNCPDVVLAWPSAAGETYLVQYRPDLNPGTAWVTLTNSLPDSGTGLTVFVHSNMVLCLQGGSGTNGGGPPPSPFTATSPTAGGSGALTPWQAQGRPPYPWELQDRPPYPWEPGASIPSDALKAPSVSLTGNSPTGFGPLGGGGPDPNAGFYRVVRYGPSLFGVTNGTILSGSVTIPVEFGATNSTALVGFTLYVDGQPASSSDVSTNALGQWILSWDTSSVRNGSHTVNLSASYVVEDYSVDHAIDGVVRTVNIDNGIMFPQPNLNLFGSLVWFYFETKDQDVNYRIDLYIETNVYIGSFTDHISNGVASFLWDSVTAGFTNDEFRCEFYAAATSGGGTSQNTNRWFAREVPFTDSRQMAVAWAAPTANPTDAYRVEEMVRNGVLGILDGAYQFNLPNDPNAQAAELLSVTKDGILLYMGQQARESYIFAHGDESSFGPFRNPAATISRYDIIRATGNLLYTIPPRAAHPFKLAWIDGCSTAKGIMCEAFGIPAGQYSNFYFNGPTGTDRHSRAFVGAYENVAYNYKTCDTIRALMLARFWTDWRNNETIYHCCTNAAAYPTDPLKSWRIHGATDLTIATY